MPPADLILQKQEKKNADPYRTGATETKRDPYQAFSPNPSPAQGEPGAWPQESTEQKTPHPPLQIHQPPPEPMDWQGQAASPPLPLDVNKPTLGTAPPSPFPSAITQNSQPIGQPPGLKELPASGTVPFQGNQTAGQNQNTASNTTEPFLSNPIDAQFGVTPPSPFQPPLPNSSQETKPKFVRVQSKRTQDRLAAQSPPVPPQASPQLPQLPQAPPGPPQAPPVPPQASPQPPQAPPGPPQAPPGPPQAPPRPPQAPPGHPQAPPRPPQAPPGPPQAPPGPPQAPPRPPQAPPGPPQAPPGPPQALPRQPETPPGNPHFEWTSTNTANNVPPPAVPSSTPPTSLTQTHTNDSQQPLQIDSMVPKPESSWAPKQQPPSDGNASFPLYSSTDWHRPEAAIQLTANSDVECTIDAEIKNEKTDDLGPQTSNSTSPIKEQKPARLPKMKKFGQQGHKAPLPQNQEISSTAEESKTQFTKIGVDQSPQPNPNLQTRTDSRDVQSKTLDPRLLAKEASDIERNATPEHTKAPELEGQTPPSPVEAEKKIFDIQGNELSEPRELSLPDYSPAQAEETANSASLQSQPQSQPLHADLPPLPNLTADAPEKPTNDAQPLFPEPTQTALEQAVLQPQNSAIPKEFDLSQANAHIRTAESALSNDNFNVAVPLLNKALFIITESGAKDSIEALSCHQKLGECCYQKGDYDEACEHYRECKRIIQILNAVDKDIVVLIQQKLAKALEKGQNFAEAKIASQESIDLAQELLPPGHPLIAVAYRMHLTLLQKTNAPNSELEALESQMHEADKLQTGQVMVSDEVTNHVNYLTGSFNLDNIEKQRKLRQARRKLVGNKGFEQAGKGRFRLKPIGIVIGIASLGVIGIGAASFNFFFLNQKEEKPAIQTPIKTSAPKLSDKMQVFIGKTFTSADGLKSIKIRQDGIVEYKIGNKSQSLNFKEGEADTGFVANIQNFFNNQASYTFKQNKQGFVDQDGTVLYDEEAPDLQIVKEMNRIADLAKYYYASFEHKYPSKRESFSKLGPAISIDNPLGTGMKPLIRLRQFNKEEGQLVLEQTIEEFSSGKALFTPDGKSKKHPGLIECMSLRSFEKQDQVDGISFLIRAYGKDGSFITASKVGTAYVLAQDSGVTIKTTEEEDFELPFKKGKATFIHFVLK